MNHSSSNTIITCLIHVIICIIMINLLCVTTTIEARNKLHRLRSRRNVDDAPSIVWMPQDPEPAPTPKPDPECCGSGNVTDDEKVDTTIYTDADRREFEKNPGERTEKILALLKQMRANKPVLDPTVDDIKKAQYLLGLYRVLKKQMTRTLEKLGQTPPPLPSQEHAHTLIDASGRHWGEAEYKNDMDELLNARHKEIEAQKRKAQQFSTNRTNPTLEKLMEKLNPANEMASNILNAQKNDQCPETGCTSIKYEVNTVSTNCAGDACTNAPPAIDGTPGGLTTFKKAVEVPRGELPTAQDGSLVASVHAMLSNTPSSIAIVKSLPQEATAVDHLSTSSSPKPAIPSVPQSAAPQQVAPQRVQQPSSLHSTQNPAPASAEHDDCHPPLCMTSS